MTNDERIQLLNMLNDARREIVNLRRENAAMTPQIRVLNILERALFGQPREYGASPDIVWILKTRVDQLVAEHTAEHSKDGKVNQ